MCVHPFYFSEFNCGGDDRPIFHPVKQGLDDLRFGAIGFLELNQFRVVPVLNKLAVLESPEIHVSFRPED